MHAPPTGHIFDFGSQFLKNQLLQKISTFWATKILKILAKVDF